MGEAGFAGPVALESAMPLRRTERLSVVAGVVVLAGVVAVLLFVGPTSLPMIAELVTMQYVAMAAVCSFAALLLLGYAVSSGLRGYLVLAGTFFYIAGVNAFSPLILGNGILDGEPPRQILGGPQSLVYVYSLWHWVFVIGVIAGALLLEFDRVHERRPEPGTRLVPAMAAIVIGALVASLALVAMSPDFLPTMFVGGTLTPFTRWLSAIRLVITLAATAYVAVLVYRRGAPINRWLLAVLLVMVAESVVVLRPTRNMITTRISPSRLLRCPHSSWLSSGRCLEWARCRRTPRRWMPARERGRARCSCTSWPVSSTVRR